MVITVVVVPPSSSLSLLPSLSSLPLSTPRAVAHGGNSRCCGRGWWWWWSPHRPISSSSCLLVLLSPRPPVPLSPRLPATQLLPVSTPRAVTRGHGSGCHWWWSHRGRPPIMVVLPLWSSFRHGRPPFVVVLLSSSFSRSRRSPLVVILLLSSFFHHCRGPIVVVVLSLLSIIVVVPSSSSFPRFHPASSCSRLWLRVLWWWWWWWLSLSLSSCRLGILVLVAPAVHPVSSGSQQWGRVLGAGCWVAFLVVALLFAQLLPFVPKKLLVKRKRN